MTVRERLRGILLIGLVLLTTLTWWYYRLLSKTSSPSSEAVEVLIPTGSSLTELVEQLWAKNLINNRKEFVDLAVGLKVNPDSMRSGRFLIEPKQTTEAVLNRILYGKQDPLLLVFTDQRELTNVAARAARYLEPDSAAFIRYFQNAAIQKKLGLSEAEFISLFIPNTYECYWNTSPVGLIRRMRQEHERFWNTKRLNQAQALGLSTAEVYTLASIIERETRQDVEKQRMAGVYYNRLEQNMLLQADPTAVFASRDFHTNQVTNRHLSVDSPYNTYRYKGLPPGPITMASIASIDAVLQLEPHRFLFFCARGDGSGLHNFAVTLEEHKENVALYRKNKNRQ